MSDELCIIVDTSGFRWEWPCAQPFVDPCITDGSSTLFHVLPCTAANPPLPEWCALYPTHPVCVQNGLPKLPPTGSDTGPITASGLLVAGLLCLVAARRRGWR